MCRSRVIQRAFARRAGARSLLPLKAGCREARQRWPSSAGYIGIRCTLSLVAADMDRTMHRISPRVFSLRLLENRALKQVNPLKGKFRSFLLASFQNFLSDEASRARCLKRGGDREFVFLDAEDAERRYRLEPADYLTAEKIFDARWAMTLLGHAVERLRGEYAARGEMERFEVLKVFVGVEESKTTPTYEEVAKSLRVGVGTAKTLIHRFRKQYAAILRQEIGRTISDPADIEQEINALCNALVVAEGRL